MGMDIVYGFSGARGIKDNRTQRMVRELIGTILKKGRRIAVGCAMGVDTMAVSAGLYHKAADKMDIFAMFGPDGEGAAPYSSNVKMVKEAVEAGAKPHWYAGGSVEGNSMNRRLAMRSMAMVEHLAAHPGSGLVALTQAYPKEAFGEGKWPRTGSGTWSTCGAASQLDLPVIVFQVGWDGDLPALPGKEGRWVKAAESGVWSTAWMWKPY